MGVDRKVNPSAYVPAKRLSAKMTVPWSIDLPHAEDTTSVNPMDTREDRLDSWKEIAVHFGRTVRTVQRWEDGCGMPVHRHGHRESSSVYAFRSELDAWYLSHAAIGTAAPGASTSDSVRRGPGDMSADDLHLIALDEWNNRTLDGLRCSLALSEQAIRSDPEHGPSYAMIAMAEVVIASHTPLPVEASITRARKAALRALELDEDLADAHAALGLIVLAYDWDWEASERAFLRAVELDPSHATAWSWLGFCRIAQGKLEQALVDARRGELIDPASLIIKAQVGWFLYFMRRHAEAVDQLEKTVAMDPRHWRPYLNLAWVYTELDRLDDALKALEMASAFNHWTLLDAVSARVHARAGRRDEARHILKSLITVDRYASPYFLSHAWAALGEFDEAHGQLERSVKEREWHLLFMRADPGLDPVRESRQYKTILQRIGFAMAWSFSSALSTFESVLA